MARHKVEVTVEAIKLQSSVRGGWNPDGEVEAAFDSGEPSRYGEYPTPPSVELTLRYGERPGSTAMSPREFLALAAPMVRACEEYLKEQEG